jgi:thioredoxin reductase
MPIIDSMVANEEGEQEIQGQAQDQQGKSTSSNVATRYDVIIIGSGPAGYTAGIYTSRAKLKTLIISGMLPGGQLMTTSEVENYPGFPNGIFGPELMMNMRQQAERFGSTVLDDEVIAVNFKQRPFIITTPSEIFETESVLVCTGGHFSKAKISSLLAEEIQLLKKPPFLRSLGNP